MLWRNYRSGINPSQFAPLLEFWSFVQREEIGAEEPAGRLGFFSLVHRKQINWSSNITFEIVCHGRDRAGTDISPSIIHWKNNLFIKGKGLENPTNRKKNKLIPSKCDRFTKLIRDYNGLPLQEYRKEQQDIHNRELGLSFEVTIGSLPDVSKSCPESHYHTLACHLVIRYLLILYIWKSRGQLLSGGCRLGSHHARIKIHLKFHL